MRRVGIALIIGAAAAGVLECVNGVFTFLLPPLIVITPVCLITALIVGMRRGRRGEDV